MTSEFGLQWGHPTVKRISDGLRTVRRAVPTERFWAAWRIGKEGLKSKGYALDKVNGIWIVSHWQAPSAAPAAREVPELDPVRPLRKTSGLLPYQIEPAQGLLRSLRQFGAVLDASDTGTGKTYVAMAVARELGLTPLVICPLSVIPAWERVARLMGHPVQCVNYEKIRMGNTPWCKRRAVQLTKTRSVEAFQFAKGVNLILFDEAHRCAGLDTLNSALMIGAAIQRVKTLAMSATAVENPLHMRALGFLLGLHALKDFWDWAAAHGCYKNQWDGWEFGGSDEDLMQIRSEVFPARGIRIRWSELGSAFPETQITTSLVPVDDPGAVDRAHEALAEALERVRTLSDEDDRRELNGAEHLVQRLRLRQTAELQKLPGIAERTKDALAEGRSVFISVNFSDSVTTLRKLLGNKVEASVITGGQSPAERERNIADFQSNRNRVCIANGAAGGVGVSLHDLDGRHPRTAFHLPGEDSRVSKQLLGRVWRQGGSHSVQHIVYAAGTVEESMCDRMEDKLRRMDLFNDGDGYISP